MDNRSGRPEDRRGFEGVDMTGEPESLDIQEDLERRRHRHWFDRLIMLSDGVFAIAATLLSLDIHGPADWRTLPELWSGLVPQLSAYLLSFLVISIFWLAHRRFMAMITTVDAPLTVLTLVMLGLVGLVPGITHIGPGRADGAGMQIYASLITLIGLSMAGIWGYAALIARLVTPEVPNSSRWFQLVLMALTAPLFLALTMNAPFRSPFYPPIVLAGMFLIGWRMRIWVLKRLERKAA
jgi:uncharacterized membrane protein